MGEALLLSPLIFTTDLVLLLRCEVIGNIEGLADLFWRLALDHVCDSLAPNIEKSLDVKIVGSKNDLEQHFLVDLHKLLVPFIDVRCLLARVGIVFVGLGRITTVMFAPLDDLLEDGFVDLKKRLAECGGVKRGGGDLRLGWE
jgi:hypothetical protein